MDTRRLPFLDGLRIAALGLLIAYHVGMYYVTWGWHVKSPFASPAAEPVMFLSSPWRMSLLFLISGAATSILVARRGDGWLRPRLARLGWPLLFGMLVIVPPQSYFQVVEQAGYDGGFLRFMGLYLSGYHGFCGADGGCLRLPTWNHLWFLPYLMVYTAGLWALLRAWPRALDRAAAVLASMPAALALFAGPWLLLAALRLALRAHFEVTHALVDDVLAHAQFLPAFAFGALWARMPGAWAAAERLRWLALAIALVAWATMVWGDGLPIELLRAAYAAQQWCGVLAAVGFGHRHLGGDGPWRRRLSDAVFPVYVLHQTLIVVPAVALRPLGLAPALEAPLLAIGTLAGAAAIVVGLERLRAPGWLRRCLGMADASRAVSAPRPAAGPARSSAR